MRPQSYLTTSVPVHEQGRYWESSIARYFGRLRSEPNAPARPSEDRPGGFEARCDVFDVGGIAAVRMAVPSSRIARLARDAVDSGGDYFKLSMQLKGRADVSVGGRSMLLGEGDWILLDQRQPYIWECIDDSLLFGLQIPRRMLAGLKLPAAVGAMASQNSDGSAAILAAYLQALNAQLERVADNAAAALADASIGLLVTAVRGNAAAAAHRPVDTLGLIRLRATHYVALHAGDAQLSVDGIAAAMRCSRRHLYKAFAGEPLTPERLIWQVRLEHCRDALLDPRSLHRPVSSIAYENGFNSDAHFARLFKRRYGCSATALRAAGTQLPGRADSLAA